MIGKTIGGKYGNINARKCAALPDSAINVNFMATVKAHIGNTSEVSLKTAILEIFYQTKSKFHFDDTLSSSFTQVKKKSTAIGLYLFIIQWIIT
jgi:hypothetical protein